MKQKFILGLFIFWLLNVPQLFAQGTPCGDSGDPDVPSQCPLDTWVLLLVAAFLIYATVRLYEKQKSHGQVQA